MTAYIFPIKTAFILFPILAMFLLIPFLIFNYRKYGYLNKWRSF
ncbi:VanZ family protein, partial [Bacillus cereus group sp. Bce025]